VTSAAPLLWSAVVPVKLLALAKSRLASFGDTARAELALAFADDVVTALLQCPRVREVLVVTDDVRAADALRRSRTRVLPDRPGAGLNAALRRGADLLAADRPDRGVVALASDLPALQPGDLARVLDQVRGRGFVADAEAVGTTVLAAAPGSALDPAYGPGSRRAHLASGAVELAAPPALRRDVDTPEDLREALLLGVGPRTARVTARLADVRRPA
jgi:2-phospho-L-lactate guanylyltransferase